MKKLFLLLSAGLLGLSANAQQNQSIMLAPGLSPTKMKSLAHPTTLPKNIPSARKSGTANKTTNANSTGWFDYFNQLDGGAGIAYYFSIYQDSSLYDDDQNAHIYERGLGVSFDPTDSAFSYTYQNNSTDGSFTPLNFMVTNGNAYTVDSFYAVGKYMMNNVNNVDTLLVDLAVVTGGTGTNTFILQYPASATGYEITGDGTPRFADAAYNGDSAATGTTPLVAPFDQLSTSITTTVQRYSMVLNSTVFADTDQASGNGIFQFTMNPPLSVPAGAKVVSYVHFKSGAVYPFATSIHNANYFHLIAGDPTGTDAFPPQSVGSAQAGLEADNQNAYNDTSVYTSFQGVNLLIANSGFTGAPGFDAPEQGFYVTCTSCNSLSVPNVTNVVSSSNAYPSPANSELYVPFTLSTTADVTVTLTNTLGQVVRSQDLGNVISGKATFTTSNLAGGIYFYTVNANGQRTTGRVLIAH